jgi:hypothetical protein
MQLQVSRLRSSSNSKCSKAIRQQPNSQKRRLIMEKPKKPISRPLRAEVPELLKIATGRQARPPELDTFAAAFAVAGEKQEMVADQETLALLKRFARDSGVAEARAEFEHAQRAEETFHKDFDGLDLTMSVTRIRTITPPVFFPIATIQK